MQNLSLLHQLCLFKFVAGSPQLFKILNFMKFSVKVFNINPILGPNTPKFVFFNATCLGEMAAKTLMNLSSSLIKAVKVGNLNGGPRRRSETDARYSQQLQTGCFVSAKRVLCSSLVRRRM